MHKEADLVQGKCGWEFPVEYTLHYITKYVSWLCNSDKILTDVTWSDILDVSSGQNYVQMTAIDLCIKSEYSKENL
jgi:hypothetical protein